MINATLIALPKPFIGETAFLQETACKSWAAIPNIEVVLMGDELGIEEICRKYDFIYCRNIEKTEFGTPILNDAFSKAKQISKSDTLIYINADIIIDPSIAEVIKKISFSDYLLAGRRTDVQPWHKEQSAGLEEWKNYAEQSGRLVPLYSSDFFVLPFSSKIFNNMPELVVGRKGWDNWIMFQARNLSLPLIDGTEGIRTIHRIHGYSHIKDAQNNVINPWDGKESRKQIESFGDHQTGLDSATHYVNKSKEILPVKKNVRWFLDECTLRSRKAEINAEKLFWQIIRKCFNLISKPFRN